MAIEKKENNIIIHIGSHGHSEFLFTSALKTYQGFLFLSIFICL
jgi:hypothetical protein